MLLLPAEITHANGRSCVHMLLQALRAEDAVAVADAGNLLKFDSCALAVLLECRREAQILGKTFSVRNLPTSLRALAALYGAAELLPAAP